MLHPTHPHPTPSHLAPAHPPSYPLPVRVVQLHGIGLDGTPDGSPDGKAALNKSGEPLGKAKEGLGVTVMPPHCIFLNLPAAITFPTSCALLRCTLLCCSLLHAARYSLLLHDAPLALLPPRPSAAATHATGLLTLASLTSLLKPYFPRNRFV